MTATFDSSASPPPPPSDPSGLEAAYSFAEGSGNSVADASGNHNPGTIAGAGWTPQGKFDTALSFDGVNDYVNLGGLDSDGTGLTLAAWIKPTSFAVEDARILSKATGTAEADHYWMLGTTESNGSKLRFRLKTNGTTATLVASSGALTPGVWTHVSATYDGQFMRLYKDGIEVGALAKTGAVDRNATIPVWVGSNPPEATSKPFHGVIDEVKIYTRALSASELQAEMNTPVGPPIYTLTVTKAGAGSGVVSGPGIACGTDCFEDYEEDTPVTLVATADVTSMFVGWSGGCDGQGQVSMTTDKTCTATFDLLPPPPPPSDPSGLEAAYSFAEGSGNSVADASGNHNPGTIAGAGWTPQGKFDTALSFDGVNDYVNLGGLDSDGTGLTLAAWIKPTSFAVEDARILSKATGTAEADHYWMLGTTESNGSKLRFRLKTNGTTATLVASSGALTPGVWTHVSATYDGQFMRLYKDGIEVGALAKTGAVDRNATIPVWVGSNPPEATSKPFHGVIDEVKIYTRALSASELQAEMTTPVAAVPPPLGETPVEISTVTVNHKWKTVFLQNTFIDPIVVAKPASWNGPDPGVVRLRNITPTSFQIRFQEWGYLNDLHVDETVSYIAVERGHWFLPDGGEIEAGSLDISNSHSGADPFVPVLFDIPFATTPVVFSTVGTVTEAEAVTTRQKAVAATGFEVILQEQETEGGHAMETVSWLAWEPGSGEVEDSIEYEADSQAGVTDAFSTLNFSDVHASCFLADMQTFNGPNTATLRYQNLTSRRVKVKVDEDQSLDTETTHIAETVGYVAFECN